MPAPRLRQVQVRRERATRRDLADREARLVGRLRLVCEVLKEVDGWPNFLHIGSGALELSYDEGAMRELAVKAADVGDLIGLLQRRPEAMKAEHMEVVRYADRPCIPGSSLKGTVRSRLELSFTAVNRWVRSCFHRAGKPPAPGQPGRVHFELWKPATEESRVIGFRGRKPVRDRVCDATKVFDRVRVCVVCDLLGAPGLASRVLFGNLEHRKGRLIKLELDGHEKLWAFEPGSTFEGDVAFVGLREEELGLLLVGLGATEDGNFNPILMGKSKYRPRKVIRSDPPGWEGETVRFGAVKLGVKKMVFTHIGGEGLCEDVIVGDELKREIGRLVTNASRAYNGLNVGFSEVSELSKMLRGGKRNG